MDVIRGNQTLFMRRDEVEAAWKWIDPILAAWEENRQEVAGLYRRHLGAVRVDRADRTRRTHLARERMTSVGTQADLAQLRHTRRAGARRWPRPSPASCRAAIERKGSGVARRFRRHDAGGIPAHAVDEADRLEQGHRDAGRRAFRAADLAALQCRAWCARRCCRARRPSAQFVAALSRRRRARRPRPSRHRASCSRLPGRSTWRCSAWGRTATPPRSFPDARRTRDAAARPTRRASCCRSSAAERRRAAADADRWRAIVAAAGVVRCTSKARTKTCSTLRAGRACRSAPYRGADQAPSLRAP